MIAAPVALLPGSPEAVAWLADRLSEADDAIALSEAWMLDAVPHQHERFRRLAAEGKLAVGNGYVRLSGYCGVERARTANRYFAQQAIAQFPGADTFDAGVAMGEEEHASLSGVCLTQRMLARQLFTAFERSDDSDRSLLRAALPALSAAGIGGAGDADARAAAIAALRSACRAARVDVDAQVTVPDSMKVKKRFDRRVPAQELEGRDVVVRWNRSKGLTWTHDLARDTRGFCSLEVQGDDAGGFGAFVAGLPPRPRVFEAAHMRPALLAKDSDSQLLVMRREIQLPAGAETERYRVVDVDLGIRVFEEASRVEVEFAARDLARDHRYRLWFPVPFYPRPAKLPVVLGSGSVDQREVVGPFEPVPVDGAVTVRGKHIEMTVTGDGLCEVEVFPRANDHVVAVTVLRSDGVESNVFRRFAVEWTAS